MRIIIGVISALISVSVFAAGPSSLLNVKPDISKENFENLKGEITVVTPLTDFEHSSPSEKETLKSTMYRTKVLTPFSESELKAIVSFDKASGGLSYFSIDLDEQMYDTVGKQIRAKYGKPAKSNNTIKEEQCLYKNGANFKKSSGMVSSTWTSPTKGRELIELTASKVVIDPCPSRLDSSGFGFTSYTLSISKDMPAAPKKNPF